MSWTSDIHATMFISLKLSAFFVCFASALYGDDVILAAVFGKWIVADNERTVYLLFVFVKHGFLEHLSLV